MFVLAVAASLISFPTPELVPILSLLLVFNNEANQSQKIHSFVPHTKMNGKVGFHA